MTTRILPALVLAATVTTLTGMAQADDNASCERNVKAPVDAAVLYEHIRATARMACNDAISPWDGQKIKNRNRCIDAAVENAVATLDQPELSALHRRTGEKVASL